MFSEIKGILCRCTFSRQAGELAQQAAEVVNEQQGNHNSSLKCNHEKERIKSRDCTAILTPPGSFPTVKRLVQVIENIS